jgi:hypothetical protein
MGPSQYIWAKIKVSGWLWISHAQEFGAVDDCPSTPGNVVNKKLCALLGRRGV